MPELPEAQTIASDLDSILKGALIVKTLLMRKSCHEGPLPLSELVGKKILGASRRGSCVLVRVTGG
jgi:formamidopyrimidine-DNA glycosylase